MDSNKEGFDEMHSGVPKGQQDEFLNYWALFYRAPEVHAQPLQFEKGQI